MYANVLSVVGMVRDIHRILENNENTYATKKDLEVMKKRIGTGVLTC